MQRILIQKIGPLVSLQDAGRSGWQRFGVTESGVLDRVAFAQAQALTGADCVLEMAGYGGVFKLLEGTIQAAITGATMRASLNGIPLPHGQIFDISADDILEIGAATQGYYGYLAFAGQIDCPIILGAKSTHLRAKFGGYQGRTLQEKDLIKIKKNTVDQCYIENKRMLDRRIFKILWSAQSHLFSQTQHQRFLQMHFRVSHIRDRMAMLLEPLDGCIECDTALTGLSEAVVLGDIQIAGDGRPRALLSDRQPTGGYPRIATLISADIPDFVQLPTGAEIKFEWTTLAQAQAALIEQHTQLAALKSTLKPIHRCPKNIPNLLAYNLISGVTTGEINENQYEN